MRLKGWRKNAYHFLLWVIVLVLFSPVLWIIMAAFKSKNDILATPPQFLFMPTMDNFVDFFTRPNVVPSLLNSLFISIIAMIVAIGVSFLAAYSFSRFKPRGTDFLMFVLLSIRMVPAAAVVIPMYMMYITLGWKDSYFGMIMFYAMFSIPFTVWILKGFIDGVSPRYDETGLINGGSRLHVLFRVVLPQILPGLVAAFIFNLIFVWNEFLFNYIIGGRVTTMIPVTLSTDMYADAGVDWPFVATMITVYMTPPIVIMYFFQKYLLVGMTFGTVRGEV